MIPERANKIQRLTEAGFDHEGSRGWSEDRYYEFTRSEIIEIEDATIAIHDALFTAIDVVCQNPLEMTRMGIPVAFQSLVAESWIRRDPTVSLRFDLARNRDGQIKLIEINGDTPTTVIETALIQWFWLVDNFPDLATQEEPGQFNSLHERLKSAWMKIAERVPQDDWMAFSAHTDSLEEFATCEYHRDLATQCGLRTGFVDICPEAGRSQFLYNPIEDVFHEPGGHKINYWYKLYPWEWLWNEEFGPQLARLGHQMGIIEPAWKVVCSNKAILSVLHKYNPDHPNLVPAFDYHASTLGQNFVKKPIWGREGTGIELVRDGQVIKTSANTPDPVSNEVSPVYQSLIDVQQVDGHYVQFGSWIADNEPSGMIIRESNTPIITGQSPVVPHLYR